MKKLIKKIAVFLCATLIAVCSFGCADGVVDKRTNAQIYWDEFCSIQPGVYYIDVENIPPISKFHFCGTRVGEWSFHSGNSSGHQTENKDLKIEITGTGLDMEITILEGAPLKYNGDYNGCKLSNPRFNEENDLLFDITGYPYDVLTYIDFRDKNNKYFYIAF